MGHRLHTYNGVCSSLHGHNVRIEVVLRTDTFVDFKVIDSALRDVTDILDHAMVLHSEDPLLPVLVDYNKSILASPKRPSPDMLLRLVVLNVEPTTEAIAQLVFNRMHDNTFVRDIVEVVVHETDKYRATYRGPCTSGVRILGTELSNA